MERLDKGLGAQDVLLVFIVCSTIAGVAQSKMYHFTVATQYNDPLRQFLRSAEKQHISVQVLGLNSGICKIDLTQSTGGMFKLKLLYQGLVELKRNILADENFDATCVCKDKFYGACVDTGVGLGGPSFNRTQYLANVNVMFTDSYDVIYLANSTVIETEFERHNVDVLFGAERNCWPDDELSEEFPELFTPYRYLNSGGK